MKNAILATKSFVQKHKTPIVGTTIGLLTAAVLIQRTGIKSLNNFLVEKNLFDEYYTGELMDA